MCACLIRGVMEIGESSIGTDVVESFATVVAFVARLGDATKTNSIANFEVNNLGANSCYSADNLVTRNERITGHPPVIVNEVNIGVANSTVGNQDVNISFGHGLGGVTRNRAYALGFWKDVSNSVRRHC